jgi:putative membrane protein
MAEDVGEMERVDPRTFFAAERTYLAWLRTGLALMGFGFVVARFGLFLRELQINLHQGPPETGASLWLGMGLVATGVLVEIAATLRHLALVKELRGGAPFEGRPSKLAIAVAMLLALAGIALAVYLEKVR